MLNTPIMAQFCKKYRKTFLPNTFVSFSVAQQPHVEEVSRPNTHTHTHTHTHALTHKHTHAHTRTHPHTHSRARAHIHALAHTLTHAHSHTCPRIHTHERPHSHTHTHTQAHAHTQSVGLFRTSNQLVAEAATLTTHNTPPDENPCPQRDCNPLSQQLRGRRPMPWTERSP
jgi:hypothetical protein